MPLEGMLSPCICEGQELLGALSAEGGEGAGLGLFGKFVCRTRSGTGGTGVHCGLDFRVCLCATSPPGKPTSRLCH